MDAAAFRAEFPVLDTTAYLNAGTDGPLPRTAIESARAQLQAELTEGRATPHFLRRFELMDELRHGYSRVLGCDVADVALTTSTSEGLGAMLAGMDLGPGDEIVSSDQEHPGMLGPLKAARDRGVDVRLVPFAELANAVGATTTLVACSHVGWISGEVAPAELAEVGVPVILDGAQGAGAIALDVGEMRCAAYAAAGQKWLCGADGTGLLYLQPEFAERVRTVAPTYFSFEDASQGLDSALRAGARRLDTPLSREALAVSAAALDVLEAEGLNTIYQR